MVRALGDALSRFSSRWVPDPFTIAIGLTLFTFVLAMVAMGEGPLTLIGYWGGRLDQGELLPKESGLWKLLGFGMQMCLILVTGHALASSPPVRTGLTALARLPRTAAQAVALTAVVAMVCALINWGLGLIVGALLARTTAEAAKTRGIAVHYPLMGAAGYSGLLVWHGGLSGSAPLSVTQQKDIAAILGNPDVQGISLSQTVFSPMNGVVQAAMLLCVPVALVLMLPRDAARVLQISDDQASERERRQTAPLKRTPAARFEGSFLLAAVMAAIGLTYLYMYLSRVGFDRVDLNAINLLFLSVGLLLHGSARSYSAAVMDGATSCGGIILAFPFYAGIMGMMALSGMVSGFAQWVTEISGPSALSPLTFLSAGLVNLFVPSGGGQWAIQGPLVIQAAQSLSVPLGKVVMALAYGDAWTNMLQPFWALPLLGITGLQAREIIGYTGALMLLVAPIFLVCLVLF